MPVDGASRTLLGIHHHGQARCKRSPSEARCEWNDVARPLATCCLHDLPEGGGGLGVAAGDSVGVLVEGGRHPAVVETPRDDDEGDAGVEHLGGHEVAQVVQPERSQPGGPAVAEEGFGDPVRLPRRGAAVVTEHEPLRPVASLPLGGEHAEHVDRHRVEVDDVTAFGLGGGEHRAVGSFDPAGAERHPSGGEVDVVPAQPEQLGAAGAGERRQHQQGVQVRVACRRHESSSVRSSSGVGGRSSAVTWTMRWARSAGLSHTQPQRIACANAARTHDMDAGQGAGRQRSAAHPAAAAQRGVGGVEHRGGDVTDRDVAEVRVQVAVEHRAGLANRGRRPTGRGDREPRFEQFADRGTHTHRPRRFDGGDHRGEFAFGVAHGRLAPSSIGSGGVSSSGRRR